MLKSAGLLNFTTLFRGGDPFKTDAVIQPVDSLKFKDVEGPSHFRIEQNETSTSLFLKMDRDDKVFGLGENLGGLNKRGRKYRMYAKDDGHHTPDKMALYGSHPFMLLKGKTTFGMFLDYPSEIFFDVGYEHKDEIHISIPSRDFDLYIFDNPNLNSIIHEFLLLTGKPYMPPKWAFGFQQCRYSYPNAETMKVVANKFRSLDIPCDAIYMDIDYMQDYKVFTVDDNAFPNFEKFVNDMREDGFRLVPILDPGVKVEEGYSVYEDGKEKGYFCKTEEGPEFMGAVWPGLTHFPDFLNPEARKWWGDLYENFAKLGIISYWNDMNEPAIFFTPAGLKELAAELEYVQDRVDLGKDPVAFLPRLWNWWHSERYYKQFYHNVPGRGMVKHHDVHNLYGMNMARASAEGLLKHAPDQRYFMLSRSSYVGAHRFAVIWTGDNHSWWEHLLVQMRMMMSLNMAGFFYMGADVGGFGADASSELLVRWMQLGAFTPLYRNHSVKDSRHQEPYAFDDESTAMMRDTIRLRYAFLPYAYSEFMRSTEALQPFITPLFLTFESDQSWEVEDQFMYGSSLMVAPVHVQNARGRYVYLPDGQWLHWSAASFEKREMQVLQAGNHYLKADLSEIPLFVRENHLVTLTEPVNYVEERQPEELVVVGLVTSQASFKVMIDDGITFGYQRGKVGVLELSVERDAKGLRCSHSYKPADGLPCPYRTLRFEIYAADGTLEIQHVNV
jgi:alpha-glucosidase